MSISLGVQKPQGSESVTNYDAIVVGAGPYGLSTAAYLKKRGLKVGVFGKPLQFWREYMPKGMLLRSYWWATNISDPHKQYGLDHHFQETGQQAFDPLPAVTFIDYGLWFQKHVVPNVDESYVESIELGGGNQIDIVKGYRVGGWMRYLDGDLTTTILALHQRGRPGMTPPAKAIFDFCGSFFIPMRYDSFDWKDPLPTWKAAAGFARYWSRRIGKRLLMKRS